MNMLDIRTIMIIFVLCTIVCSVIMAFLWRDNRCRFQGIGFWLVDFIMHVGATMIISLRGIVPDSISIALGNPLSLGGTMILYLGLERFTGKRSPQMHNALLFLTFVCIHLYFLFADNNLQARNINFSVFLIIVCIQCVWLMLRRVESSMRPLTSGVGYVFAAYGVFSIARIITDSMHTSSDDFFRSSSLDALILLMYLLLFIILTFSLYQMVNRRLFAELNVYSEEKDRLAKNLNERVKELTCLHDISRTIESLYTAPLKILIDGIMRVIPSAFQHPDQICVRISLNEDVYHTDNFKEPCVIQKQDILPYGRREGLIEIGFLNNTAEYVSLPEASRLIAIISERIARIIERKRVEGRLIVLNRLYRDLLSGGSLKEKAQRITDTLNEVLGADFTRIWVIRE
ncbi:MAG: hypothetical protein N3B18_12405, partial [Desulfobacterota bacterium]|nr:hypothetical protein [Thermodesulfobacteriota bacterium]